MSTGTILMQVLVSSWRCICCCYHQLMPSICRSRWEHIYLSNGDDEYGFGYGANQDIADPATGGYVILDTLVI